MKRLDFGNIMRRCIMCSIIESCLGRHFEGGEEIEFGCRTMKQWWMTGRDCTFSLFHFSHYDLGRRVGRILKGKGK